MRKFLVAIVALMTSLSVFAGDIDLFFKGGASISKFNLEGSENRMGVAAGFGGKFFISDSRFFIMPQAMYAQKGQDSESQSANFCTVDPVMMHMIEVPVLFGGKFDLPVKDMYLTAGVGAYICYDYRFSGDYGLMYVRTPTGRRGFSHGDVGIAAAFEVHYKKLFLFYDYDLGLRDITKDYNYIMGESVNHRSMRIGAGFAFPTLNVSKQRKKPQM